MEKNHNVALLLSNEHNQIHHADGGSVSLIAQHGFKFKCSAGRATTFNHDIQLGDKHITSLIDPALPGDAVTKHYFDSKLALAVNELITKIYLNTASLSNLQTDMISRIEAQSTAAASANSNYNKKNAEMLGKIELNILGLVSLRRETTELLNTTRTAIEADHEQKMSTVRSRQQEIINNITSTQRILNLLRTRHSEFKVVVDANKIITDDLVSRVNATRFVKNNVGLVPRLTSNTSKDFIVTASHNSNDAWKVFNSTTGYFWNPGVAVDEGRYVQQISIQIKLSTATRIHKIGFRARSDSERIKLWSLQAKNKDGVTHTIYNPNDYSTRAEDKYIGGSVKYFDIPLRSALNYMYYTLLIDGADSRISNLTYFQIYSLDEIVEMPISSDGSFINAQYSKSFNID